MYCKIYTLNKAELWNRWWQKINYVSRLYYFTAWDTSYVIHDACLAGESSISNLDIVRINFQLRFPLCATRCGFLALRKLSNELLNRLGHVNTFVHRQGSYSSIRRKQDIFCRRVTAHCDTSNTWQINLPNVREIQLCWRFSSFWWIPSIDTQQRLELSLQQISQEFAASYETVEASYTRVALIRGTFSCLTSWIWKATENTTEKWG